MVDVVRTEVGMTAHGEGPASAEDYEIEYVDPAGEDRPHLGQHAEREGVLLVDRSAGQGAADRAAAEDEGQRAELDRVLGNSHHDERAAGGPAGGAGSPGRAARRRGEDGPCPPPARGGGSPGAILP